MLRDAPVIAILPAADIEGTKKFYLEKLNLRPADIPVPGDDIVFEGGDETYLYLYEREGGTKADHTVAGWRVDDVEAAVEELRDRGVVFEKYDVPGLKTNELGIAEVDGEKAAWFKDPEGNVLAITEMGR